MGLLSLWARLYFEFGLSTCCNLLIDMICYDVPYHFVKVLTYFYLSTDALHVRYFHTSSYYVTFRGHLRLRHVRVRPLLCNFVIIYGLNDNTLILSVMLSYLYVLDAVKCSSRCEWFVSKCWLDVTSSRELMSS